MTARRSVIASIGAAIKILESKPEVMESERGCYRCKSRFQISWNGVIKEYQCWTCRSQWTDEKVHYTVRADLTDPPDCD